MKVYVITHKPYKSKVRKNDIYSDLLVGAETNTTSLVSKDILKDDNGENISNKNKSFCELTGLYWMWKNSTEDIIGLEHYRRYLVKDKKTKELLDKNTIQKDLQSYDIILPQPLIYGEKLSAGKTAARYFGDCHDPLVWTLCRDIIADDYSDYLQDFDWFSYQLQGYCFNMFIANKNIIDEYCKWLFPILFDLESKIDISKYDSYNQRMFGFVSERLLNVWLHHNNLTIKEYPVYMTEEPNLFQNLFQKVKNRVGKLLN